MHWNSTYNPSSISWMGMPAVLVELLIEGTFPSISSWVLFLGNEEAIARCSIVHEGIITACQCEKMFRQTNHAA